uniref:YkvA family protein n=1 Tax=Roseivirga sp. TaxID=1964215 RepID=UPI004048A2CE
MSDRTVLNDREEKFLDRMKMKAAKIVNDREELKKLLAKAQDKMAKTSSDDSLKTKVIEFLSLIIRMIRSYIKGDYKETPWQTLVMFVAGILYFITPLDAIPDFIPVAGLIDDATVLVWLGKCFKQDLSNYKKWEEAND